MRASESLVELQHPDGHWVFELEADVTIPSEFILLQHYLGCIEPGLQARIAEYIRATQGEDGGWPLFYGGALDLSAENVNDGAIMKSFPYGPERENER